jgi:hypothetical protein
VGRAWWGSARWSPARNAERQRDQSIVLTYQYYALTPWHWLHKPDVVYKIEVEFRAILIRLKNPRFSKIYKNIALDYQRLADDQNDEKGVFQQNQYYGLTRFSLTDFGYRKKRAPR